MEWRALIYDYITHLKHNNLAEQIKILRAAQGKVCPDAV